MTRVLRSDWLFAAMWFAVGGGWPTLGAPAKVGRAVPVIYCTDLFHPHVDPDDHFDLAALYAVPELDIKGIVLDRGRKQLERPGRMHGRGYGRVAFNPGPQRHHRQLVKRPRARASAAPAGTSKKGAGKIL